ncbi:hypothetical protein SAMN06309944_0035 [Micrococcales bacterium KH10]|nr:hypothetical protein SAMN06309944_0035 [Micrococcales bacterium KH10]
MFVLTLDQNRSRSNVDRVPEYLDVLQHLSDVLRQPWVLTPERTVGDELQCVTDSPALVLAAVRTGLRLGQWQIGIGAARLEEGLSALTSTREARGKSFINARNAVEKARSNRLSVPVCVVADKAEDASIQLQSLLRILGVIYQRRTVRGWEVIDANCAIARETEVPRQLALWADATSQTVLSQRETAERIGVSPQSISQNIKRTAWNEELELLPLLAELAERIETIENR